MSVISAGSDEAAASSAAPDGKQSVGSIEVKSSGTVSLLGISCWPNRLRRSPTAMSDWEQATVQPKTRARQMIDWVALGICIVVSLLSEVTVGRFPFREKRATERLCGT